MRSAQPLDRFPLVNTRNPEEARAALRRIYATPKLELAGREKTLHAIINHFQLSHVRISYGSYAASLHMQFPETNFASQIFPIGGKSEAVLDRTSVTISPDCGVVVSPNEALSVTNNAEYERLVLSVNANSLASKLAAISGESCCAALKFHPIQDFSSPAAEALRHHFLFFVAKINELEAQSNFVLAELEQTLLVMFLYANRQNYSHLLERASPNAAAWQVRRAEEYIEANWQQPITLEDLAEISGTSVLSLLRSFRKSRGYSPMQFANRVRLNHARDLLRTSNADTTIAAVAATCGFPYFGRFASDYVEAFGEHPSQTLGRSQGGDRERH